MIVLVAFPEVVAFVAFVVFAAGAVVVDAVSVAIVFFCSYVIFSVIPYCNFARFSIGFSRIHWTCFNHLISQVGKSAIRMGDKN